MSILEIVLYAVIGVAVVGYIGMTIYRIKHPKKKKDEDEEE